MGLARSTINRGEDDLDAKPLPKGRVRHAGGGRDALCHTDTGLLAALRHLVEPATLGDPVRPLIWVSKSLAKLATTLTAMGHPVGPDTVRKLLVRLGFSRQSNRKTDEGSHHPDRDEGTARQLQECRHRLSSATPAVARQGARCRALGSLILGRAGKSVPGPAGRHIGIDGTDLKPGEIFLRTVAGVG
jgi:hypothetical protein